MVQVTLVDDDPNFGFVSEMLFKRVKGDASLQIYQWARKFVEEFDDDLHTDIVLLDINMPDLNGWEVLNKLEQMPNAPVIYMLSSSIDQHDIERARNHHLVYDYISKPLTLDKIKQIIDSGRKKVVG